jgi:hypothetical protein
LCVVRVNKMRFVCFVEAGKGGSGTEVQKERGDPTEGGKEEKKKQKKFAKKKIEKKSW